MRLLDLLQPYLAGAASWPAKWDLTPAQAGDLYLLLAQALESSGASEEAQAFLVRYLATLEGASAAVLQDARPWIKLAMLNFVKAAAVSQKTNLPRLAAVSTLLCSVMVFSYAPARDAINSNCLVLHSPV